MRVSAVSCSGSWSQSAPTALAAAGDDGCLTPRIFHSTPQIAISHRHSIEIEEYVKTPQVPRFTDRAGFLEHACRDDLARLPYV
jgi:hypothetical protein